MPSDEIDREQEHLSMLYGQLDELRRTALDRRAGVLREGGGTHQARSEREARAALYNEQVAQFDAVENGLCFGRLDFQDGDNRYIGRLGIFDTAHDYEPLLVDWRAEAARPFYLATAASPQGVRRRRHLRTSSRRVTGIEDEVLDLADAARQHPNGGGHSGLVGEAVLLAAVGASRTGQMKDIVETIQADQDRIIRAPADGVLVVQGGPGTGKTAVALHRAAYLLYTHREQLRRRGVLIVGPNPTFLRYIERVLPSLGETSVLLSTLGELYPGVRAERDEPPATAEIKGRLAMAEVIAAAVRDRQPAPETTVEIPFDHGVLPLDPHTVAAARERARRSRLPHNQARAVFDREVLDALAQQLADRMRDDVLAIDVPDIDPSTDPFMNEEVDPRQLFDPVDIAEIRRELGANSAVRAALDELWPVLTPQRLLSDLYASAERLERAAPGMTAVERAALHREGDGWTPADVPLLDEAAELLGEDDREARAWAAREERERIAYAQGVLDILSGSESTDVEDDAEIIQVRDLLVADDLAGRHERGLAESTAQRAAADRSWAYGHIVVDEAQELSAMAWRTLMRRCPSRSMTIVGDVAQTGDPGGTDSWGRVLAPYVADRWRLAELTVNYRTPAEVMDVAAEVLARIDPDRRPPRSVRQTGIAPWRAEVSPEDLAEQVADLAAAELDQLDGGRLALLVPTSRLDEIRRAVPDAGTDLERPVVVLTVKQAKGLEFDSVIVVDPQRIRTESPRGDGDLYVALTRTTRRLGVVLVPSMILTPFSQLAPRTACSTGVTELGAPRS